ncbi:hypothetical protein AQAU111925_00045 [Aquirufa aurantiipilula]
MGALKFEKALIFVFYYFIVRANNESIKLLLNYRGVFPQS